MTDVANITSIASQATAGAGASASELNDQFLQLLVTQLKNQDPLDPLKNEDFVAQLAQLQQLDQSIQMAETNQAMLLQSSLATGASLIGKEVAGLVPSGEGNQTEEITGKVSSIKVEGGNVLYSVELESGATRTMLPANVITVREPEAAQ